MAYLFTDITGTKVIEVCTQSSWVGYNASKHREKLSHQLGKPVISWCQMGMQNPDVKPKKKKKHA